MTMLIMIMLLMITMMIVSDGANSIYKTEGSNLTSEDVVNWVSIKRDMLHEWYDSVDSCMFENFPKEKYDPETSWSELQKKYENVLKESCHGKDSAYHAEGAPGKAFYSPSYHFSLCPAMKAPTSSHYMMKVAEGPKPRSNMLIKLMESLYSLNRSLIFLGDSVTFQNYEAFLLGVKKEADSKEGRHYNVKVHRWLSHKNVPHRLNFSVFDPIYNESDKYGGGSMIEINNVKHLVFYIRFYKLKFWSIHNYVFWITEIDNIIKYANLLDPFRKWGAVIVANAGLHVNNYYEAATEFENIMGILHELHVTPRNNVRVLWRETSATHFPGKRNGYYTPADSSATLKFSSTNHSCVAFNASNPVNPDNPESAQDWRNDVASQVYARNNYIFGLIPFARHTRPLHDMHIGLQASSESYTLDCAHLCWFPQLWQPVWDALYNTIVMKKM